MKRTPVIFLIATLLILVTPRTDNAEVIQRIDMPIATDVLIPCVAGGQDEIVALSGVVHLVFSVTTDSNGGLHINTHSNNQGVSGTGVMTGDKYQATGSSGFSSNTNGAGEFTFVDNFGLIGQGPGNNFVIRETAHMTINANGDVTANISSLTAACR